MKIFTIIIIVLIIIFCNVSTCNGLNTKKKCHLPISATLTPEEQQVKGFFPKVWKTYMVPMSDGVHLHTNVISPFGSSKTQWPVVIDRSPYGGMHTELLADIFLIYDFIAIGQDMRGTCKSEGNFSNFHSDQKDGNETVNWILQQPWSNGEVYEIGASADGIASLELGLATPKSLKAQFIIVATGEAEETFYPGGAFRAGLIEKWLHGTIPKQADGVIKTVRANEGPGKYWDSVEYLGGRGVTRKFNHIKWPIVMWGGWYDIFQHGNVVTFEGIQHESDPSVRGKHYLVMDPLGHCQAGASMFPHNLIAGRALLPIFLGINLFTGDLEKGKVPESVDKVTFYVMGSNYDSGTNDGNYWTSVPEFPKYKIQNLYFNGDGSATFDHSYESVKDNDHSTYTYDPSSPVPTNGGNNLEIPCGPLDQTKVLNRPDVLVFTTDALNKSIALTGPLDATLYVSTSKANDTDFTVKLMDVYPDGRSILIQDGIRRMRWRNSRKRFGPEGIVPGEIYKVGVSLWNTSYVFSAGHKISVAISSSNAPRFEPNSNTGLPLSIDNVTKHYIETDNTLYHSEKYPSSFQLPTVEMEQLPKHGVLNLEEKMMNDINNRNMNRKEEGKAAAGKIELEELRRRMMKLVDFYAEE